MDYLLPTIIFWMFQGAHGVSIIAVHTRLMIHASERTVILPCSYTTNSDGRPQTEWYLRHADETDELVARIDSSGQLTEGVSFTGRLQKFENASLTLSYPRHSDSGKYACEITITKDLPQHDTGLIELHVRKDVKKKTDKSKCSIHPTYQQISTNDTVTDITLPCVYTTTISDHRQTKFEWSVRRPLEDETVMEVDENGKITEGPNFAGHLTRGTSASLVLRRPTIKDTGVYACRVSLANGIDCSTRAIINLLVESGFKEQGANGIHPHQEISTNDTVDDITLPCIHKPAMSNNRHHKIEWSIRRLKQDETVMEVDGHGKITGGPNFAGRVARGSSASLIIREPTIKDAGVYVCQVSHVKGIHFSTRAIINLQVENSFKEQDAHDLRNGDTPAVATGLPTGLCLGVVLSVLLMVS